MLNKIQVHNKELSIESMHKKNPTNQVLWYSQGGENDIQMKEVRHLNWVLKHTYILTDGESQENFKTTDWAEQEQ